MRQPLLAVFALIELRLWPFFLSRLLAPVGLYVGQNYMAMMRFHLFRTYPICDYSGDLGPKQQAGDLQSPEGFYRVTPGRMNPESHYHLSFDLGYPNAYDQPHLSSG